MLNLSPTTDPEIKVLLKQVEGLVPKAGRYLPVIELHVRVILNHARALPTHKASLEKFAVFALDLFSQLAQQEEQNEERRIAPGSFAHLLICDQI